MSPLLQELQQFYQRIGQTVTELVAPPYCSFCKIFLSQRNLLCNSCRSMITPVVSISIPVTSHYTVKVLAVSAYHDPLKHLILAKGYSDVCASNVLGHLMWQMTYLQNLPIDYFIPVPLHWIRFAKRGFNQAEEMALVLAQYSGKPVVRILKRHRRTQLQSTLSHGERSKNVQTAFSLNVSQPELYRDRHLVLVDDLMTTGSTLKATALELIKLKPASITAIVVCRVV